MRISIVTHHFPPKYHAGAEQYAYRIAQALQKLGHSIEIVAIESIQDGKLYPSSVTETYHGLRVHRLFFDLSQAPNPVEWSFRNPELRKWLGGYFQNFCPDIVHINSGYLLGGGAFEAAFNLQIPTVVFLHDYWFLCPLITLLRTDGQICSQPVPPARCVWCELSKKRRYRLPDETLHGLLGDGFTRLAENGFATKALGVQQEIEVIADRKEYLAEILERTDLAISPSRFLMDKITEYGLQPRRLVYLPFGLDRSLDVELFPRDPSEPLRIGYLGQFYPHKGVHLLISAFKKLTRRPGSCKLILYGNDSKSPEYVSSLKTMAGEDSDIQFAGPYQNSEVGKVLSGLDVIAVPSIWYENRPTVIVEAQAYKTPVIASNIGGMTELVRHDQDGLLFEMGSVDGLACQLQRLLDEPGLLPRLRQGIGPIPTMDEEMSKLVELYESLL